MTTVQKFQELGGVATASDGRMVKPKHPVLSEAENLFVLTDEAHRTQYGSLAANLRAALPNAVFFGFTGTPIDKKDRARSRPSAGTSTSTPSSRPSKDGATVPIFYESRLPELRVLGNTLDKLFDRVFADRTTRSARPSSRSTPPRRPSRGRPKRIEAICLDLVEHFSEVHRAQRLQGAGGGREPPGRGHLQGDARPTSTRPSRRWSLVQQQGRRAPGGARHQRAGPQGLVEALPRPERPAAILIVCDMLLTGFDAPIEQVMYLDSPLREHTLLQAIARVNRTAEKKTTAWWWTTGACPRRCKRRWPSSRRRT
jgi:type I restriction enzyme R subunit